MAQERQRSLRDKHAEQTRQLIIEAMVDQLGETGAMEFSVFEIARRSNVSARTIYRHFPTRDDLFNAMSEMVNERVGFPTYARTPEGVAALVRQLFPSFDEHEKLILAQLETPAGQTVRAHARTKRADAMRATVDAIAPDLPESERAEYAAICHCIMSADAWRRMRTDFDIDGTRAGAAAGWALETLFAAIAERNAASQQGRRDDNADN